MSCPANAGRLVGITAPRWSMINVAGVALTTRLAGDNIRVVVERSAAEPALMEQWAACGLASSIAVVDDLTSQHGEAMPLSAMLVLTSARSTPEEAARAAAVAAWCRVKAIEVCTAELAPGQFAPGWEMATLPWRHIFEASRQNNRSAAPA